MIRKLVFTLFFLLTLIYPTANLPVCSAAINTAKLSPEAAWISLDLPLEQRKQIDAIITDALKEASLNTSPKIKSLDFSQMYTLSSYLNEISDARETISDRIMQVLTPQQRRQMESQLDKKNSYRDQTNALLLTLNLTDKQQLIIINSLLQCQRQSLSIVSDQKLSWEDRRKKLEKSNPLRLISRVLTKTQLTDMTIWSKL